MVALGGLLFLISEVSLKSQNHSGFSHKFSRFSRYDSEFSQKDER
jgi:hypothetical protein